jgi:hypothetical protein
MQSTILTPNIFLYSLLLQTTFYGCPLPYCDMSEIWQGKMEHVAHELARIKFVGESACVIQMFVLI